MSGFFRRLLAFVLGVLVAYVGVAFWAYQNVRPMKIADTGITISEEIDDYSLEQFAELVVSATKNPTDFSFDRLEKEYGVDLKALLEKMGVDVSNANEEDWNAFKNISVLNLVNGIDPFLDNIKLRALYPLLPSITKLSLDEILSPEAQVQLGDYSVYELMQSDAATKEIGLMTALKGLTVGSLVPSLFDATYDEANHRYLYTVKEDSPAQILNLIANVQLKGVVDIIGGADVMEEIMEGGLKPIADMPIAEIIGYVLDIAGEEVKNVASDYVRVLGDLTFSDMFKREGDGYVFTTDNIATELEFGYLFGLTKGDDGVWYKDKEMTQPADGVFGMLADFKLVDLFDANGDPVAIVESVLGEMSIKTIYETIYEEDDIPFFANVLKDMTVNDLLRGGVENVFNNVVENVDYYLSNLSIGDLIGDLLPENVSAVIDGNDLLKGLMKLRIGDFIADEYTVDTFVDAFDHAIGDVSIGGALGFEKTDGVWNVDFELLGVLFNIEFGDVVDAIRSDDLTSATQALIGSITFGDVYNPIFSFTREDETGAYHNGDRYLTKGFGEFLDLEIWRVVATFDPNNEYDITQDIFKLTAGDVIYSLLETISVEQDVLTYSDEKVTTALGVQPADDVIRFILNTPVQDYVDHYDDLEWWKEQLENSLDSLTFGYIYNLALGTERDESGAYHKGDRYLTETFGKVLDLKVWAIVETLEEDNEYNILTDLFKLTAGDVVYSVMQTLEVDQDWLVYEDGKVYVDMQPDVIADVTKVFMNIPVQEYVDNYDNLEWWKEKAQGSLDRLTFGYIYNLVFGTERDENGAYHKGDRYLTETFGDVLDLKLWAIIDTIDEDNEYSILTDLFKLTAGDVAYSIMQTLEVDQDLLVYEDGKVYVDMQPDVIADVTKVFMNIPVQEYVDNYDKLEWWMEKLDESLENVTYGYIYNLVFGTERDENGAYHKGDRYLTETFGKVLDLKVWTILETIDEANEYNILTDLFKLTAGDVAYSVMQTLEVDQDWLVYEDGKVYVDMQPDVIADVTKVFMNIPVQEYVDNYDNLEWWMEKLDESLENVTYGYIYNLVFGTERDENGAYHKGDRYLTETFGKVLDLKIWTILETIDEANEYNILTDLFKLTAGDVVYSVMQTLEVDQDWLVYEDGKVYVDMQPDVIADVTKVFMNIPVQEYVDNYDKLEWWMEKLDESLENVTYGYIYNLVFGTERDENGAYHKGDRYLTETFGKVLDLKVWTILETIDEDNEYSILTDLFKLTAGDVAYSVMQTLEIDQDLLVYEDGKVYVDMQPDVIADVTKVFMNIPVQEYVDNYDNLEWWMEKLDESLENVTYGYIYNLVFGTERDENGAYHKGDRYLTETFGKVLDLKVWAIVETLEEDSEYNILTDLFRLTAGDVAYSVMQTLEVDQDWLVYEDGKVYVDMEPDVIADVTKVFMNIPVQEYVDNYDNLEWWMEKLDESLENVTYGYIYNLVFGTERDENGAYHKGDRYLTETFGKVLDLKVWTILETIDEDNEYNILTDLFKLTAGDVAYSIMQTLEIDQDLLVYEDGKVYVDMQPDVIADVTKVFMNITIQEYVDNYDKLDWWKEKTQGSLDRLTFGYIYNIVFGTETDENGEYHKGDRYLTETFGDVLDLKLWAIIDTIDETVDYNILTDLFKLTAGDVVYSVMQTLEVDQDLLVYEDGKVYVDMQPDVIADVTKVFMNIPVQEYVDNYDNLEWWFDKLEAALDNVTFGYLYDLAFGTERDEDGLYHKGGRYLTEGFSDLLNVQVSAIIETFREGSEYNILTDLFKLSAGDIAYSVMQTFEVEQDWLEYESGKVALSDDLGTLKGIAAVFINVPIQEYVDNYDNVQWWSEKLNEVIEALDEETMRILAVIVTAVGTYLYEFQNPFFVELIGAIFGEEATFKDVLGEVFSDYVYDEQEGKYYKDGYYNPLFTKWFDSVMTVFFNKEKYDMYEELKEYISLANFLTLTDDFTYIIESLAPDYIKFVLEEDGLKLKGDLYNLSDFVLNFTLDRIEYNENEEKLYIYALDEINALMLGDLYGFAINLISTNHDEFSMTFEEDGSWTFVCPFVPEALTRLSNVTIGEMVKYMSDPTDGLVKRVFADMTVADVLSDFNTDWQGEQILDTLFSAKVADLVDVMMGRMTVVDVYGDKTINDFISGYLPEVLAEDTFTQTVLDGVRVVDIYNIATVEGYDTRSFVFDVIGKLKVEDILNTVLALAETEKEELLSQLPTGREAVDKLLAYELNAFRYSDYEQVLDHLLVGDVVAGAIASAFADEQFGHEYEINSVGEYEVSGFMGVLLGKIYNLTLNRAIELMNDGEKMNEFIMGLNVGDVIADIVMSLGEATELFDQNVTYDGGEYIVTDDLSVLGNKLYNMTVQELIDTFTDDGNLDEFMREITIGDLLADILYNSNKNTKGFDNFLSYEEGKYVVEGTYGTLYSKLYNTTVYEFVYFADDDQIKADVLARIKVGDILLDMLEPVLQDETVRLIAALDVDYDKDSAEYVAQGQFAVLANKIYNKTLNDFYQIALDRQAFYDLANELQIGDIFADLAVMVANNVEAIQYAFEYVDGEYVGEGTWMQFTNKVFNWSWLDLWHIIRYEEIRLEFLEKVLVGDVISVIVKQVAGAGFAQAIVNDYEVNFDGERYNTVGSFSVISDKVYNKTLKDVYEMLLDVDKLYEFADYLQIGDIFADLAVFVANNVEAIQYTFEYVDGKYVGDGTWNQFTMKVFNWSWLDLWHVIRYEEERQQLLSQILVGDIVTVPVKFVSDAVPYIDVEVEFEGENEEHADRYVAQGDFEALINGTFNLNLYQLYDMVVNFSELKNYLFGYKLGDYAATILNIASGFMGNEDMTVYADGRYSASGLMGRVIENALNLTINELYELFVDGDGIKGLTNLPLGYYISNLLEQAEGFYNGTVTEDADGKFVFDGDFDIMLNILSDINLFDFIDNFVDKGIEYITVDLFGEIMIGELLGNDAEITLDENDEQVIVWYDAEGNQVDFGTGVQGLMSVVYEIKLKDITNIDLNAIIGRLTLRDVLSESMINSNAILSSLADYKIMELSGDTINAIALGELMGYYQNEETGVWYTDADLTTEVEDHLMLVLIDYKVGDITGADGYIENFSEDVIENIGEKLTLEDVLGDRVNSNTVFKALAKTYIKDLGGAVNDLQVGSLMGFYFDEQTGVWYEDDTKTTLLEDYDKFMYVLADYKIGEMTGNENYPLYDDNDAPTTFPKHVMNKIIATMTLIDVLGEDTVNGNNLLKLVGNVKLKELTSSLNDVSIGALMGYQKLTVAKDENNSAYAAAYGYYFDQVDETNNVEKTWFKEVSAAGESNLKALTADGLTAYAGENASGYTVYFKYVNDLMAQILSNYTVNQLIGADSIRDEDGNEVLDENGQPISFTNDVIRQVKELFTLRDILGNDVVDGSSILKLVGGYKIGEIPDKLEQMYIGQLMASTGSAYAVVKVAVDGEGYYFDDQATENNTTPMLFEEVVSAENADLTVKSDASAYSGRSASGATVYYARVDEKLTQIIGTFMISEVNDDGFVSVLMDRIKNQLTLRDVMGNSAVDNNRLLSAIGDYKIADLSSNLYDVKMATLLGYVPFEVGEKDAQGHYALDDNGSTKWFSEITDTSFDPATDEYDLAVSGENDTYYAEVDEIMALMAGYNLGNVAGADGYGLTYKGEAVTFSKHLLNNMLDNVSVGTIYPNASESNNGFMGLLDPTWKLGEMTDKVSEVIKSANVGRLIKLNAFGDFLQYEVTDKDVLEQNGQTVADDYNATVLDYFDTEYLGASSVAETYTVGGTTYGYAKDYSNYVRIDTLFENEYSTAVTNGETEAGSVREYWLALSMPEFMNKLMNYLVTLTTQLQTYAAQAEYFAAYVTYQNNGGTETFTVTYGAYSNYYHGSSTYAQTLDAWANSGSPYQYSMWITTQS